jgi:putative hemolysin
MVPRTEVTALPIEASIDDVIQLATDSSFTRVPVYDGDTDHMVGIIKTKKLLTVFLEHMQQLGQRNGAPAMPEDARPAFDIRQYMTEPMLVPETLPATEVLTLMRQNHSQMAIVIDEYGGTAGIVTLQDIVEHLIGHIQEEIDTESAPNGRGPDGELHLDGLTGLAELRDEHDIDLETGEYDVETLGGYVFFVLGRQAQVGDEITGPHGEILTVEAMDGLRVARVAIKPVALHDDAEERELMESVA